MIQQEKCLSELDLEEYHKAKTLFDTEANESRPYEFKYQAREIFTSLKNRLEQSLNDSCDAIVTNKLPGSPFRLLALSVLELELGHSAIAVEESHLANSAFPNSIAHIRAFWQQFTELSVKDEQTCQPNTYTAGIELLVLNQQALLAVDRGNPEEGERLLRDARRLFLDFRERHPSSDTCAGGEAQAPPVPHSPHRLIDVMEAAAGRTSEPTPSAERDAERRRLRWIQFESNATLTLYYLAQVLMQASRLPEAADCFRQTLKRQIELHSSAGVELDRVDWARNCATLSQHHLSEPLDLHAARYCLAAAEHVLAGSGAADARDEKSARCAADLHRYWLKYGLQLLQLSAQRVGRADELGPSSACNSQPPPSPQPLRHECEFQIGLPEAALSQVTAAPVSDLETARALFLFAQRHLRSAASFYTLDSWCSDHIDLLLEWNSLLRALSAFESGTARRCQMWKRGINQLNVAFDQLNPQFFLVQYRSIAYTIASNYQQLFDYKSELFAAQFLPQIRSHKLPNNQRTKAQTLVEKTRKMALKSADHYCLFLQSYAPRDQFDEFRARVHSSASSTRRVNEPPSLQEPCALRFAPDDELQCVKAYLILGKQYSNALLLGNLLASAAPTDRNALASALADAGLHVESVEEQTACLRASERCYRSLLQYAARNGLEDALSEECRICTDILALLPFKVHILNPQ